MDEVEPLCGYLALPSDLSSLVSDDQDSSMQELIRAWCQHPDLRSQLNDPDANIIR